MIVIGGTGLIGSKLVALLQARGHEALAASPQSGVNTLTGEGLADALARERLALRPHSPVNHGFLRRAATQAVAPAGGPQVAAS